MEFESITFTKDKIILNLVAGLTQEYTKKEATQYLKDTGREADLKAMGWTD